MADIASTETPIRSPGALLARLSAMLFLQFWSVGLWIVTVKTFIATNTEQEGEAIFTAGFVGYSASAAALGGLAAPVLVGWLADRFIAPERMLAVLQLGAAVALWSMHEAGSQTAFFIAMIAYFQMASPSVVLTSTIAFASLADRDREFPIVRLFGTAGWIAAGVFVGVVCRWWFGENIEPTRLPMTIAAWSHVAMSLYALTLPHTPPTPSAEVNSEQRWGVLSNRSLLLFLFISLLAAITSQAYDVSNVFLNQQGYEGAAAKLTLGQLTEVICLAVMPWLRSIMRLKTMFLIGVLAWGVRYVLYAAASFDLPEGVAAGLVYSAILVHGPAFGFVYLVGQMYVDRLADPSRRGAAQGLHAMATGGFGHLLGAGVTGWSQSAFLTPAGVSPPPYDWFSFWMTPVAISIVTALLFALFFSDHSPVTEVHGSPPEDEELRP